MALQLTQDQESIRETVEKVCLEFEDDFWLEHDESGEFPEEFYRAMAEGGWLGIAQPEEYGGAGLGVTEATIMMHTVAKTRGGMSAASAIHMNIFGPHPISVFGSEEQKARWIPDLIAGKYKSCFGVTEPNSGLNTANLQTRAERTNKGWVVSGRKIWTSTAQVASKIMLIARTTPQEDCAKPIDGLSLFFTDLDRNYCDVRRIPKMGRKAVDSNEIFIDGLPIPQEDLVGEEGKGFRYLLHSLNPERILVGAEAIGIGQQALEQRLHGEAHRDAADSPVSLKDKWRNQKKNKH